MRTLLLRLFTGFLMIGILSGCESRDTQTEQASKSADLVDARHYLPNAPQGSLIHMPLSAAVGYFYEGKGRLPANLEELVQAGFVKALPEPPAGKRFVLDRTSMQVLALPQ